MISKGVPGKDMSFGNCTWLAGTAFNKDPPESVYQQVMKLRIFLLIKQPKD